jgi:hypothetical protein
MRLNILLGLTGSIMSVMSAPGQHHHHNLGLKPADSAQVFCKTKELNCPINRVFCGELFFENQRWYACSRGAREWLLGCRLRNFDSSMENCYNAEGSSNGVGVNSNGALTSANTTMSNATTVPIANGTAAINLI